MSSLGIFEIEVTIRGRKFLHPVTVVEDINDNILGIDFMQVELQLHVQTNNFSSYAHKCPLCSERSDNSGSVFNYGHYKIQRCLPLNSGIHYFKH
jgi:hypothetical protein